MISTPLISPQRDRFDLPRDTCYLNAAYMGPMPKSAVTAGQDSYARRGQPWHYQVQADFFDRPENLRGQAARLFGARANDIALVPAASYGLTTAARNLAPDARSEILVLAEQFPSNVYVWRDLAAEHGASLRTVTRSDNQSWTEAVLAAISPATSIVACPQLHWVDGGMLDLAVISDAARRQGAALVLDLTQSLGILPFDLAAIQPDFAVAASYKWLLGPYAMGFLYVAPHHQGGEPLEQGWIVRDRAEDFTRLVDYADDHAPGARRFDMGERSNFQLVPAAAASLDAMLDWGADALAATLGQTNLQLAERLAPLGLRLSTPDRAPHYLSLSLPDNAPADLLAQLAAQKIFVSQRGDRMRITPHVYNDEADFQRFASVLETLL